MSNTSSVPFPIRGHKGQKFGSVCHSIRPWASELSFSSQQLKESSQGTVVPRKFAELGGSKWN